MSQVDHNLKQLEFLLIASRGFLDMVKTRGRVNKHSHIVIITCLYCCFQCYFCLKSELSGTFGTHCPPFFICCLGQCLGKSLVLKESFKALISHYQSTNKALKHILVGRASTIHVYLFPCVGLYLVYRLVFNLLGGWSTYS